MQPATVDDGVTEHVNRSCQGDTRGKSWDERMVVYQAFYVSEIQGFQKVW